MNFRFLFLASANYCTSPPSNFSPSGRIRVGPDYVVWLYCSLPFGASEWNYEDGEVTLSTVGNKRSDYITVAGGTFNFTFEVEDVDKNDEVVCITTSAKVDFMPQNLSTGTFLEMNCSGLLNTMAIPVTVEGEVLLALHMLYILMWYIRYCTTNFVLQL